MKAIVVTGVMLVLIGINQKMLKTKGERDAKMTTHAQKINNRNSQKPSFVR